MRTTTTSPFKFCSSSRKQLYRNNKISKAPLLEATDVGAEAQVVSLHRTNQLLKHSNLSKTPPSGAGVAEVVDKTARGLLLLRPMPRLRRSSPFDALLPASTPSSRPVAGILHAHLAQWSKITQDKWVLKVLKQGYALPWGESGPPPLSPTPLPFSLPVDKGRLQALEQEVNNLLSKGAVEAVDPSTAGFYGRLFVVPKHTGGWRPVLDLSPLNVYLEKIPFDMETAASIRRAVRQDDWATSLDLSDAYFHILIAPRFRKFLRFCWKGKVLQFRTLPFGLSLAPYVFSRIVAAFVQFIRTQGIRFHAYLDDWLCLASLRSQSQHQTLFVLQQARQLGFKVNDAKSDLVPSQDFSFLGMEFSTTQMIVKPSAARTTKLWNLLSDLENAQSSSARTILSLLGIMESLAPLIQVGRIPKRPLQRQLKKQWSMSKHSLDFQIQLQPWIKQLAQIWKNSDWLRQGVPITQPAPLVEIYTDASHFGWGAHMDRWSTSGQWSLSQSSLHINDLELEAVNLALRYFHSITQLSSVRIRTDNTTVVAYVNKQGGARSSSLSIKAEQLLTWCRKQGITLSALHVAGKLNVLADQLSRSHQIIHTEWTLSQSVLQGLWMKWFKPMVDLFASRFNHRLPTYVSLVPEPTAWKTDALSFPWTGLIAYAFPPLPLMERVIAKARVEKPSMILIAPKAPNLPWFPSLLQLTHVPPIELQLTSKTLLQPRTGIGHSNPMALRLHAWMLCAEGCVHQVPL